MNPEHPLPSDIATLLKSEQGYLRSLVSQMVPMSEVDDLLQLIMIKAARAQDSFRGASEPRTWLHQIARNAALDYLRSRQHRQSGLNECLPETDDAETQCECRSVLSEPAVAVDLIEKDEMNSCIREYVKRLPPAYRQIIELKDLYGLTSAEIADQLGIELSAAKIRLHRARAALKALLAAGCEIYTTSENTPGCDRKSGSSEIRENSRR